MPKKLIQWSKKNFSHLPWREERTLYRTLVSEIMLQQTTVGTVLNHFERFIKRFPNIQSLAKASEQEVLVEWKGLGYYRRAKNLKKIADQIQKKFHGEIPIREEDLLSLNGVGPYTASALISIGHNQKALAVDANLERVISRLYSIKIEKGPKLTKKIYEEFKVGNILNVKNISYRELNEALMDLGRTYCKASTVECQNCLLSESCNSFKNREQLKYPTQKLVKKESFVLDLIRMIVEKSNKYLAYKKEENEWLHGQWELPTFILKTNDPTLKQYPTLKKKLDVIGLPKYKTSITKYKITNFVIRMSEKEFKGMVKSNKYFYKELKRESNLSTASIKALSKI